MTKEQKLEAYKMRLDGCSFQEIADHLGVSRQLVHQNLPHTGRVHEASAKKCIYPNISRWIRENGVGYSGIAEKGDVHPSTIANCLSGNGGCNKRTIDAILTATGLTYEEAFSAEKE